MNTTIIEQCLLNNINHHKENTNNLLKQCVFNYSSNKTIINHDNNKQSTNTNILKGTITNTPAINSNNLTSNNLTQLVNSTNNISNNKDNKADTSENCSLWSL